MGSRASSRAIAPALLVLGSCLGAGSWSPYALGQDAPALSASASSPVIVPDALGRANDREPARIKFLEGMALSNEGKWELALEAFRASIALRSSRAAMKNVAICLERLGHVVEALEALEAIALHYPQFTANERQAYDAKLAELGRKVGVVELRIHEPGWTIAIDGRDRGVTPLPAPLRLTPGPHTVRMTPPGGVAMEEPVDVIAGGTEVLYVKAAEVGVAPSPPGRRANEESAVAHSTPDRAQNAVDSGAPPARFGLGIRAVLLLGHLDGDVARCSGCDRGFGVGGQVLVQGGYRVADRLRLSLDIGYLSVSQTVRGRTLPLFAPGVQVIGVARDALTLRGETVGVSAEYEPPKLGPLRGRAGFGVFVGGVRDERAGDYSATTEAGRSATAGPPYQYSVNAWQRPASEYAYVSLGADVGFHPIPKLYLSAGVDMTSLFALRQPVWNSSVSLASDQGAKDGESWFSAETLSGKVILLFSPSITARYDF